MHIDGARVASVVIAPDMVEDLIAGQDCAAIADKIDKQVEELGLEF
jgi:hypothetical protein